jgi:hypothetical protein
VVKKAQQRLFILKRLKKSGLSPKTLTNFYRCTIESILSGCITASPGTNYLPSMTPTAPDITGKPKR